MESHKKNRLILGKTGEEVARRYLEKKKYKIVGRSFRLFRGEVDIIAYDRKTLVFFEVKTRKTKNFGSPEESVTSSKQQQIKRIALGYLTKKGLSSVACRFDVLSVFVDEKNGYTISHIKDAF